MRLPRALAPGRLPIEAACRLLVGNGSGSGFIVRGDGLIATCAHGVYEDAPVRVEFADQTLYDGHVVAFKPGRDLALIQVEGVFGLPTVRLGDPNQVPLGTRLHVVGFDQLPESTYASVYLPGGDRPGSVVGPTTLEVGLAGIVRVHKSEDDAAFDCAITTRTAQVRPGSSGAMVCTPTGVVIGVHTAAMELGGFGQEISAVELRAMLAQHPKRAPVRGGERTDTAARERWERVWYALQCLEMDRRGAEREAEDYEGDLERLGSQATGDPDVMVARAIGYRNLERWPDAIREASRATEMGDSRGLWTLRLASSHEDATAILRFLEDRIEAMPERDRRMRIRETHLGILMDRELYEEAAVWGAAGEDDARHVRDAAKFLFEYARALHALGRQVEADTWLHRAVWEPGATDLSDSGIARIAVDGLDPKTRWYGFRKGFSSLVSGEAGTSTLEPLRKLAETQGAAEAAAFFGSLARAFGGTLEETASEETEEESEHTGEEMPDGEPESDPCDDGSVDPLAG